MEVHPLRIVAEVDGNHYEMMTVDQACEILAISRTQLKSLMIGKKTIPGILNYVTVPELNTKGWFGNIRILLDDNFKTFAKELALHRHEKPRLLEIRRIDQEY